jgi:hypothetical protein
MWRDVPRYDMLGDSQLDAAKTAVQSAETELANAGCDVDADGSPSSICVALRNNVALAKSVVSKVEEDVAVAAEAQAAAKAKAKADADDASTTTMLAGVGGGVALLLIIIAVVAYLVVSNKGGGAAGTKPDDSSKIVSFENPM